MQVFLETERLVLRRFTMADADDLVNLDADPDVMRYITGGVPTSRDEIETEVLPAFLDYYQRYEGYGFWAAIENSTVQFGVRPLKVTINHGRYRNHEHLHAKIRISESDKAKVISKIHPDKQATWRKLKHCFDRKSKNYRFLKQNQDTYPTQTELKTTL